MNDNRSSLEKFYIAVLIVSSVAAICSFIEALTAANPASAIHNLVLGCFLTVTALIYGCLVGRVKAKILGEIAEVSASRVAELNSKPRHSRRPY